MKKTSIYFDEAEDLRLSELANQRGTSRAQLIRQAVAQLLAGESMSPRRPRPLGASRRSDTSERVDDILSEGFGR